MVCPATGSRKTSVSENTPQRPEHERYYSECVRLPAEKDPAQVILRGVINERSGRGWRLISATREPSGDAILLVWDTRPGGEGS